MITRKTILLLTFFLICLVFVIYGCGRRPTSTPPNTSIGTISRVNDVVEKNKNRVSGEDKLFQNDSIGLINGGEGLLDFGSALILRIFNDTNVGGIKAATDPNSSLLVRLRLTFGGFTGKLNQPGKQVVFDTPNGAKITVFGTNFFLVYDPEQDLVTAGNFDGGMDIQAGGSSPVPIPPGSLRQAQGNNQPSPEVPIPFSRTEFEDMARQFQSPVAVVNEAVVVEAEPIDTEPGPIDTEPPGIVVNRVEPERLLIGSECPDEPDTFEVTYLLLDESGIADTTVEWEIGQQRGTAVIERIDDETFIAFVGPVDTTGILRISLSAIDNAGNFASSGPFSMEVVKCIG